MAEFNDRVLANVRAARTEVNNQNSTAQDKAQFFRTPFIMSTKKRRADKGSTGKESQIVFSCNPNQVSMGFPQRGSTQDTRGGKVFYYWKNPTKQSHFDLPSFTYTFQSGNIRPMDIVGNSIELPQGLDNFYQWMSIYDEDKILADGSPNFVIIEHKSSIFPNLYLEGFFEPNSLSEITESATESPMATWTAKFLVHTSYPAINSNEFATLFPAVFKQSIY